MRADVRNRASDKIARIAQDGHDVVNFWRECSAVVADVIPNYMSPCWYTLDPASLLITSHYNAKMPELPEEWLALEYYEDDVNKLVDVAHSQTGVQTLHEVTGGDPSATKRWQANNEYGADQEMIAALRTRDGVVWGAVGLYREPDQNMFDEDDKSFLRTVAPHLAEGAKRALLIGEAKDPEGLDAPGLVVLNADWTVESSTPGVERWLDDLPDGNLEVGKLPSAVLAVAGRALRSGERPTDPGEVSVARVLGKSGTWIVLHGASLISGGSRRVAVIVEPAHPARISSLLMSVYGLTERERELTGLVLQGFSTTDIAQELFVSPHTVQQHLKSVFDKTGVRSRRDLVGRVFFSHYEPRLRDNEQRATDGRPLRGNPVPGAKAAPAN